MEGFISSWFALEELSGAFSDKLSSSVFVVVFCLMAPLRKLLFGLLSFMAVGLLENFKLKRLFEVSKLYMSAKAEGFCFILLAALDSFFDEENEVSALLDFIAEIELL